MSNEETMSYEQKKQALLEHFSPYQKQDVSCGRIVDYLQSPGVNPPMVDSMRARLQKVRMDRMNEQTKKINQIQQSVKQLSNSDSNDAELLLSSI